KLVEELHAIRERLFSVNRGERIAGVCGIAAPVLGSDGVAVAALAVQGPEFRIPDARIAEIGPLVIGAAQAIAATLPRGFQL
ncbi:MAG: IclR family transcriptional regulator domain-containing protein, partial [Acidimicrobiales bacterium]